MAAPVISISSDSSDKSVGSSISRVIFVGSILIEVPVAPKDSVEEDINADVLSDIKADAAAIEVTAYMDVEVRINAGVCIEVGGYIEDEDEGEAKSSDRGTIEVGVDVVARIDISDGMLMPDVVE
nr:hypothetical protein [Tanacetum cinerariifolium]